VSRGVIGISLLQWAEAKICALTGGDEIMWQDFFSFTPTFKLMIAGNHRPRLRADLV
jgi:putative DNA primase/helicase